MPASAASQKSAEHRAYSSALYGLAMQMLILQHARRKHSAGKHAQMTSGLACCMPVKALGSHGVHGCVRSLHPITQELMMGGLP